jgi:hypothetical protein
MNDVIRVNRESLSSNVNKYGGSILKIYSIKYLHKCKCFNMESWIQKQDIEQFRCRTLYFNCYLDRILLLSNLICPKARCLM